MRFDLPTPDATTKPFWHAARHGILLIKRCHNCARAYFYPRSFCPNCWSDNVTWEEACGRANLYTWSIVHANDLPPFSERVPYVAAIVELEEGPRMMTNLVDCAFDQLRAGMPLQVAFRKETEEFSIPVFRPG